MTHQQLYILPFQKNSNLDSSYLIMSEPNQEIEIEIVEQEKEAEEEVDRPRKVSEDELRKEEDARSVFVRMHFDTKKEELECIFEDCGKIIRTTLLTDPHNKPKGMAYVCFDSVEAVNHAVMLSGTKVRNREIKVTQKRTNIKGMSKANRNGGFNNIDGNFFNIIHQHLRRGHAGKR